MAGTKSAADALQKLLEQYNQTSSYVPKTADQIRQQAQGEYQSYYDQLRLAAQQAQARNDLALQQQREGLQRTYDKQREASQKISIHAPLAGCDSKNVQRKLHFF